MQLNCSKIAIGNALKRLGVIVKKCHYNTLKQVEYNCPPLLVVAGSRLSFLGDILVAGTDTSGRDATDFMVGPLGGDIATLLGLTVGNLTQSYEGKDTNAANEAYRFAKSKIPAQNLWYTKAATNRLLFDEFQDMIAPGYREKALRRAEQKYDRTR